MSRRMMCSRSRLRADTIIRTTFILLGRPHTYALPLVRSSKAALEDIVAFFDAGEMMNL